VENTHAFDANLIILDVMFPENDISGFEIARELRKSDKTKHIQILLLSAINEKRIFPRAFSKQNLNGALLPVDDFVEKPIPPMDLLKKVRKMLGE
jgi:CheY-like chemotaxis protein